MYSDSTRGRQGQHCSRHGFTKRHVEQGRAPWCRWRLAPQQCQRPGARRPARPAPPMAAIPRDPANFPDHSTLPLSKRDKNHMKKHCKMSASLVRRLRKCNFGARILRLGNSGAIGICPRLSEFPQRCGATCGKCSVWKMPFATCVANAQGKRRGALAFATCVANPQAR